jgi:APA family basic amino acid/polyamine antiporter
MSLTDGDHHSVPVFHNPLKRTLTALDLTGIGISGIVGAGIYVLTGAAAAQYAGPAVIVSFLISAVCCGFACLCYSELASVLPVAGSAYSFTSATLGQLVGFCIGHDLALEYLVGAATVAVGWSGYFTSMLKDAGITLPAAVSTAPARYDHKLEAWVATGGVINLPAIVICLAVTALNFVGVQESARVTNGIVALKVLVLVIFVVAGFTYINPANWSPFVPPAGDEFGEYGVGGVLRASSVLFFAFIGADRCVSLAGTRGPRSDAAPHCVA